MKIFSEKKGGVWTEYGADKKAEYLAKLPDGRYETEIRKYEERRSNKQNRTYRLYVGILADEMGYLPHEHEILHKEIAAIFLKRYRVDQKTGEERMYVESTAKLSKVEFMDFLKKLQIWAVQEQGVILPDPDPYHQFKAKI